MATVSFWVEKIIENQPFLEESLSKGIINHAALAEKLIPEIEEKLKKKVKFSAVNMAIRRLSERLENKSHKKVKFEKNADISLKSNLMVITFSKEKQIIDKIKILYDKIKFDQGDFMTITQGTNEVMVIISETHEEDINKTFQTKSIKNITKGLCSLSIKLPKNAIDTPGFMFVISKELAWNNISVIDFVSTFTELIVIVKKQDSTKAFDLLRQLLTNNS